MLFVFFYLTLLLLKTRKDQHGALLQAGTLVKDNCRFESQLCAGRCSRPLEHCSE